jgi:hypothetical protein
MGYLYLTLTPTLSLREREVGQQAARERVNERKKCKLLLVLHEGCRAFFIDFCLVLRLLE